MIIDYTPDVPQEIRDAARVLSSRCKQAGWTHWEFMDVADRQVVHSLRAQLLDVIEKNKALLQRLVNIQQQIPEQCRPDMED